jgi:hypothetical protein
MHPLVRTHSGDRHQGRVVHKGKTETVTGMSPEETQDFLQDLTDRTRSHNFAMRTSTRRAIC